MLTSVTELAHLIEAGRELSLIDTSFVLGDAGAGLEAHRQGHIPGAVFLDVDTVFSAPVRSDRVGGRHPLPDLETLQSALRSAGVRADRPVVVYDQGPMMGAARAWWVLRDAGLRDVRVLDGGMAAWRAAGLPEATAEAEVEPSDLTLDRGRLRQVTSDQVAGAQAHGHRLIDVRAAERFRGEHEPIDAVAGHIPGAINIPAPELVDRLGELREGDLFTCGSGITAAHALLIAESHGVRGLGIHPGSWSDWISNPDRPVETGDTGTEG